MEEHGLPGLMIESHAVSALGHPPASFKNWNCAANQQLPVMKKDLCLTNAYPGPNSGGGGNIAVAQPDQLMPALCSGIFMRRRFSVHNMAGLIAKIITRATVVAVAVLAPMLCVVADDKHAKPDIILFISDDHGWNDSGAYGDAYIKTPNIDRLAKESMLFKHAFAASPLCSPSRCVIQTGLMPHRNGAHKFNTPIKAGIKTMPEYFKELGYYTAHIGKFHNLPPERYPYDYIHKKEQQAPSFLSSYDEQKPLLLVVCTRPPHTPWTSNTEYDPSKIVLPPNFVDTDQTRTDRAAYYSDVTLMDSMLGEVLDVVEKRVNARNTLFVYTTDQGSNWPFSKWCVYDGGLRVPFIAKWPGKIKEGSRTDSMINLVDLLATCIDAAGGVVPEDIDGKSFLPVLKGETEAHRAEVFGTHTGNENGGPGIDNLCPARTIRTPTSRYILNLSPETTFTTHITGCKPGKVHHLPYWNSWVEEAKRSSHAKQIVQSYQHRPREELYDLQKDPYEMNNLAADPAYAALLQSMRHKLADWCSKQGDTLPLKYLPKHQETSP